MDVLLKYQRRLLVSLWISVRTPGCTVPTTPEQDEAQVRDIFAQNVKQHQAVLYTHAHEDHVGLFDLIPCDVPQYIGVGGQELMLAKYDLLKIAHEQEWKDSEEKVRY